MAAEQLYRLYFQKLTGLARQRLAESERRISDEQDVATSVFQSLCAGAADGRYADMQSGDDLWRLLVTITLRKAISHHRRWTASWPRPRAVSRQSGNRIPRS